MALFVKKPICVPTTSLLQFQRFKVKINVQKPRPPHFEKAKFLALTKPWFLSQKKGKTMIDLCTKEEIKPYQKEEEHNVFQEIIAGEMKRYLQTAKLIAFCHANPIPKEQWNQAFAALHLKKMYMRQYGRKTVEIGVKGTPYETILDFYVSQNLMIFCTDADFKTLLKILKKFPHFVLLAGIYENKLLSKNELMYYSKIPSLQAAQSELMQTLNTAGSHLVSNLNSHQTNLVSHLEQRVKQLRDE